MTIAIACGGSTEPSKGAIDESGAIAFTAGMGLVDSIDAWPSQALAARVTPPKGKSRGGIKVDIEVLWGAAKTGGPTVSTASDNSPSAPVASALTRPDGTVSARVFMGSSVGQFQVVARVETLGIADTTFISVAAGAPARFSIAPRDTVAYIGSAVVLRSVTTDRHGNVWAGAASFRVVSGAATADGAAITTSAFGDVSVIGERGAFRDSVALHAVPRGAFAAATNSLIGTQDRAVVSMNLDGSEKRRVATALIHDREDVMPVDWAPDGSGLVFADHPPLRGFQLYTASANGTVAPIPSDSLSASLWPRYSHDGRWIYFSAIVAQGETFRLWRMRPDGSEKQRLAIPRRDFGEEQFPSPSPDGASVAYIAGLPGDPVRLHVRTLASNTDRTIDVNVAYPSWSPKGDLIAFLEYTPTPGIGVVRPDGTGYKLLFPTPAGPYNGGLSWSPDARYLIVSGMDLRIFILDVETGVRVILPDTFGLSEAVWKP